MLRDLRKRIKNDLIYVFVLGLVKFVRLLPEPVAREGMAMLGRLAFVLLRRERAKTLRHLRLAFGTSTGDRALRKMGREVFANLGRNAAAAIRMEKLLAKDNPPAVRFEGQVHLDGAVDHGKGAIILTGHIGCWELLAGFLPHKGYRFAAVGKPLYDPRLDRLLVQGRTAVGTINFARDGAARAMIRWLQSGGFLAVLIDQDTNVTSDFVDFMGRQARTPLAPILIAQRVDAQILPAAVYMQPDMTYVIKVHPPLQLAPDDGTSATRRHNLQLCSKAVEKLILDAPTQWVWMHERWKTRPPEEKLNDVWQE